MNGRKIEWQNHVELDSSASGDKPHLAKTLQSPSIEVALTKVVEGGVAVYHSQYQKIVAPILDQEPGCDGHFIRPLLENPQNQLLLINWKSVDVRSKSLPSLCIVSTHDRPNDVCRPIMRTLRRRIRSRPALLVLEPVMPSLLFHGIS